MAVMKPQFGARLIRGHPLAQGLIGCWLFNEGAGTTVYDLSGNELHGTNQGTPTWTPSQYGGGLTYTAGAYDWTSIPYGPVTNIGYSDFSACIGIHIQTIPWGSFATIIDAQAAGGGTGWDWWHGWDGSWILNLRNGDWNENHIYSAVDFTAGAFNGLAMTADRDGLFTQYKNGVNLGSVDISAHVGDAINGGTVARLCGERTGTTARLSGNCDYAYVYNRVLAQSEVELIELDPYQMFESPSAIKKYWYLPVGGHPSGATHYLPVVARHHAVAASMPDSGGTFAADLIIDQSLAINYEGGAADFIDGLSSDCSDLRVFSEDGLTEIPYGIKQFSQVAGSRKLILGLGIKSSAPLSATANTTYRLYRGCTGGPFENRAGVVPLVDGFLGYWPLEESSTLAYDWTSSGYNLTPVGNEVMGPAAHVGNGVSNAGGFGNGHMRSASVTQLPYNGGITLSAWVNRTRHNYGYEAVLAHIDYTGSYLFQGYWIGFIAANTVLGFVGGSYTNDLRATASDGSWHLITLRSDGTTFAIYIDGQKASADKSATSYSPLSQEIHVGVSVSTDYSVQGVIDEAQIHSVARSAAWIQTYYNMSSNNDTFWSIGPDVVISPFPGATHSLPIVADHTKVAASMPDSGSTFAADLVIDEANGINWEGGAATFINGLASDCSDLRICGGKTGLEIPYGIKQFSQVAGSRKLILGLGIKASSPLSATTDTTYRLFRGCTGGPFENRPGVVPAADGFVGYWPMQDESGSIQEWTAGNHATPSGTISYGVSGVIGNAIYFGPTDGKATSNASLHGATAATILCWCKPNAQNDRWWPGILCGSSIEGITAYSYGGSTSLEGRLVLSSGNFDVPVYGNDDDGTHWKLITMIYDGVNAKTYRGTTLHTTQACTGSYTQWNSTVMGYTPGRAYMTTTINQATLMNVAVSTNWITSYYNMTNDNSTFWTIGDESSVLESTYMTYVTAATELQTHLEGVQVEGFKF